MELKKNFINPPNEYTLVSFWFWNDDLNEDHLQWQIDEMKEKGIHEFIIHPRKGLQVEYLSDIWFRRIEHVLKYAEKLGMKLWLYDEENFPSGYAGGRVLAENQDFCGKHLKVCRQKVDKTISINIIESISRKYEAAFILKNGSYINITAELTDGTINVDQNSADEILVFYEDYTLWHPAYSEDYYVDVLNAESTKAFIKYTHEEYRKRFEHYFGTVIKGFFIDEPGFYNNLKLIDGMNDEDTIPWTGELCNYFIQTNGYDLKEYLPLIWFDHGDKSLQIRNDFYKTLKKMYVENFLGMLKDYCEKNNLKLIGHLHYEEFMRYHVITQGDYMSAQDGLSFAGTDRIDLNEEKIAEKFTSSAGHIYGKERVLSETYALSGWGLTLQQMKHWANWQYVRGINLLVPHAFFSSIEGERKDECPPSQFFQNPYWKYFNKFADYIARLSYILSQGSHIASIAVYYPISSAYEKITPSEWKEVNNIDRTLIELSDLLMENQMDFDFINTDAILESRINNGSIDVRDEKYRMLIFTYCTNLCIEELEKLIEFAQSGGVIVFLHDIPGKTITRNSAEIYSQRLEYLMNLNTVHTLLDMKQDYGMGIYKAYTYKLNERPIKELAARYGIIDLKLKQQDSLIKYLHRRVENDDFYFIINESGFYKENQVEINGLKKLECWNGETGDIKPVKVKHYDGKTRFDLKLNAFEGLIFHAWDCTDSSYDFIVASEELKPCFKSFSIDGIWTLKINDVCFETCLTAWTEMGFPYYSGEAEYRTEFVFTGEEIKGRLVLDLGDVRDCAEVCMNGVLIGSRTWLPYNFDITQHARIGKNELVVKVCNTLINTLEKVEQPSGMLGCVRIIQFY